MNEATPSNKILQLEERQNQLMDELDALNLRLEQALNSFGKSSESKDQPTAETQTVSQ